MAVTKENYAGLMEIDLPHNLEAEQSVLGAILVDASCLSSALDTLRPECFHIVENQKIFEIMLRLFATAQPVDFITVLENAQNEHVFDEQGDAQAYLTKLIQIVPSTSNIDAYVKIVKEKHDVRSLIVAARQIIEDAKDGAGDAQTLMDSAEQRIYDIRQGRDGGKLTPISSIIISVYDRLQRLSGDEKEKYLGISTGFAGVDRITTGLNNSDLLLIAARPGMGKTSFALNIATNAAVKSGKKVAVFSLEMSKEQLVERILSSDARIVSNKMRTGDMSGEDWIKIANSAQGISEAPIYIDDTAGITVPEIKARLRRLKGLDLVIIDYLQLMSSASKSENRVQVVSEITRSLKIMAKELNVPVVVLSQLSRGPEGRQDHRPMLSDLRESGSIEQDADLVMFLYRDAYYNEQSDEPNVAECIISKNRHGETGTIKLYWDGEHTRFAGLDAFRQE